MPSIPEAPRNVKDGNQYMKEKAHPGRMDLGQ